MQKYKQKSLQLAKKSILSYFGKANIKNYKPNINKLKKEKSCFVTIRKNNKLRWCIWNLQSTDKLYKNIIQNAKSAAFSDPRFSPINYTELQTNNFIIEITILSNMRRKKFKSIENMKEFLDKKRPGLVIKYWIKQATFLPSVWDQLNTVDLFINRLLKKADISKQTFKENFQDFNFQIYFGDKFFQKWNEIKLNI